MLLVLLMEPVRGQVSQTAVPPDGVEVPSPGIDHDARFLTAAEPREAEALVADGASPAATGPGSRADRHGASPSGFPGAALRQTALAGQLDLRTAHV